METFHEGEQESIPCTEIETVDGYGVEHEENPTEKNRSLFSSLSGTNSGSSDAMDNERYVREVVYRCGVLSFICLLLLFAFLWRIDDE